MHMQLQACVTHAEGLRPRAEPICGGLSSLAINGGIAAEHHLKLTKSSPALLPGCTDLSCWCRGAQRKPQHSAALLCTVHQLCIRAESWLGSQAGSGCENHALHAGALLPQCVTCPQSCRQSACLAATAPPASASWWPMATAMPAGAATAAQVLSARFQQGSKPANILLLKYAVFPVRAQLACKHATLV